MRIYTFNIVKPIVSTSSRPAMFTVPMLDEDGNEIEFFMDWDSMREIVRTGKMILSPDCQTRDAN